MLTAKKNEKKIDSIIKELDPISERLLTNYTQFSSTPYFLIIKLETAYENGKIKRLEIQNEQIFRHFECDSSYLFSSVVYYYYRSFSCFYGRNIEDACNWVEKAIAILNLKGYDKMVIDLRLVLIAYTIIKGEFDAALTQINSTQRVIGINEIKDSEYPYLFMKVLKASLSDIETSKKERKLERCKQKYLDVSKPFQSPLRFFDVNQISTSEEIQNELQTI